MARQHRGEVEIVGVAGRGGTPEMADFVSRHDLGHVRQIADVDGELWERFGIVGQPAWVFVDGASGATDTVIGALGEAGLRARIEDLTG